MRYSIQRELWLEEAEEQVNRLKDEARAIVDIAEDDERLTEEEFNHLWNIYFSLWYRGGEIRYTEPQEIAQLEEDIIDLQTTYENLVYGR